MASFIANPLSGYYLESIHTEQFTRGVIMTSGKATLAVIGAGNVGASCAFVLAQKKLGDIVLLDIFEGFAKGKALDMSQGGQILNYDGSITGTSNYEDIAGASVAVVTSGFPRQPGMSREDLIGKNAEIVSEVGAGIREHAPDAVIVMVTNPLDLMTYHMQKVTGFPHNRVVGQAGILDSARMTHFVAQEIGCSNEDVQAMVLGGHGDTMVPLPRYTTVGGISITQLLDEDTIDAISKRTAGGGGEIVKLFGNGSAFYAPAQSAIEMAESYLRDKKRIIPCASLCEGEFGVDGYFIGVPTVIGAGGVEKVLEFSLTDEEKAGLNKTLDAVKKTVAETGL